MPVRKKGLCDGERVGGGVWPQRLFLSTGSICLTSREDDWTPDISSRDRLLELGGVIDRGRAYLVEYMSCRGWVRSAVRSAETRGVATTFRSHPPR